MIKYILYNLKNGINVIMFKKLVGFTALSFCLGAQEAAAEVIKMQINVQLYNPVVRFLEEITLDPIGKPSINYGFLELTPSSTLVEAVGGSYDINEFHSIRTWVFVPGTDRSCEVRLNSSKGSLPTIYRQKAKGLRCDFEMTLEHEFPDTPFSATVYKMTMKVWGLEG
jgi:hypothetical protein